jgi:hypothetical protein
MSQPVNEAEIIINGTKISDGMSVVIRVAIENFFSHLNEFGLGDDEIGKKIRDAYIDNLNQIRRLIYSHNVRGRQNNE